MGAYTFRPQGVCSQQINFEVEDGKIKNVEFFGGCDGNLQGISRLVQGMPLDEAIEKMQGIRCGYKSTSCPDQFATALKLAKSKEA